MVKAAAEAQGLREPAGVSRLGVGRRYNQGMEPHDRDALAAWVRQWQITGPLLDQLRREALARVDTAEALANLDDAFEAALAQMPKRTTSGLVEMQRWFAKLREKSQTPSAAPPSELDPS